MGVVVDPMYLVAGGASICTSGTFSCKPTKAVCSFCVNQWLSPFAILSYADTSDAALAGFTGADLQNLMNEAAIFAARRDLKEISKEEVADALERIVAGPEKKGAVMSDQKKKLVAYHEVSLQLAVACFRFLHCLCFWPVCLCSFA